MVVARRFAAASFGALGAAVLVTVLGCAQHAHHHRSHTDARAPDPSRGVVPITEDSPLIAVVRSVGDSNVTGTFRFTNAERGVRVVGSVSGLTPNAKHGCHIHVYGDATDLEKGISAGVHFNPFDHEHNLPPAQHRHAGAFPNLVADAQGNATLDFIDETITLTAGVTAILGRSVIIHENEDIGAQPWGGAGPRIAIGIIGLANTEFVGGS
ncbi:MAG: superoxide dismutase family protein [Planctomycetota bacterium]